MTDAEKSHDELVQEADAARARLLDTIGQLDDRGHDAMAVPRWFAHHKVWLLVASGVAVTAVGVSVALRPRRKGWSRPAPTIVGALVRAALMSATTAFVSASVKRLVENWVSPEEHGPRQVH